MDKKLYLFVFGFILFLYALNAAFSQEKTDSSSVGANKIDTTAETEQANKEEVNTRFSFNPTFGLTFLSTSAAEQEFENLQWLAKLQTKFEYEGKFLQFSSSLFSQYGEIATKSTHPEKSQDDFILTLTPSVRIIKSPSIRLFLETTAETDLGDGYIGERRTSFANPLFLYQTLFVGQKQFIVKSTETQDFEVTYGVGYAFQQTLTKDFKIDTLTGGGSQNSFESGISAIFQVDLNTQIAKDLKYKLGFKSVAFSKKDFFKSVKSSRGSILTDTGIFYKIIGIEYNLHLVYDKNLSPVRQLEQSLLLTFSLDI